MTQNQQKEPKESSSVPPRSIAPVLPAPSDKPCFVIAPIGPAGSDTRRRSNQIMKYLIRPVLSHYGYMAVRGDEMDQGGLITSHILARIANDPLVIADLTDANPNVYYELAVRHVLQKPFIQLIDAAQRLPFDVAGLRTIQVDHRDLDSVEDAKAALGRAIESVHKGEPIETPMSYAVELQDLRTSGKPEELGIAQILDSLQRIQSDVRRSGTKVASADDFHAMKHFIEYLSERSRLLPSDLNQLTTLDVSSTFERWTGKLKFGSSFDDEPPF